MSPELFTTLVQFGIGGIFLYYLWRENAALCVELREERQRHTGEIAQLRQQHRDEVKELRAEITRRDRERFKEATDYGTTLWQILNFTAAIAEHVQRQTRQSGGDRQDDQRVGDQTGE